MPNMDGLDATRIIRELSPNIPIIALSAYASKQDTEEALAAGCNDFLAKPLSVAKLKQILNKMAKKLNIAHRILVTITILVALLALQADWPNIFLRGYL